MVLHQDQPMSQKMDIFSLLDQVSVPVKDERILNLPKELS